LQITGHVKDVGAVTLCADNPQIKISVYILSNVLKFSLTVEKMYVSKSVTN
jgi:hypothetical protein